MLRFAQHDTVCVAEAQAGSSLCSRALILRCGRGERGRGVSVYTTWYLVVGVVFILMALSGTVLRRLPLSASMLYLGAGVLIGPQALDLVVFDPIEEAGVVERITEVAVIVSLFTAGLKLRVPLRDPLWRLPVVLASGSMAIT